MLLFSKNQEEVAAVIKWLEIQTGVNHIGNASNLIIRDGGIQMQFFILRIRDDIAGRQKSDRQGGAIIDTSKAAYEVGLTGLEFFMAFRQCRGVVYMNAGAYGGKFEVIETVTVLTREGNFKTYSNEEMNFDYRYSKSKKVRILS